MDTNDSDGRRENQRMKFYSGTRQHKEHDGRICETTSDDLTETELKYKLH